MATGLLQLYGTSSGGFTPASLSSTISWWDASDTSTITASSTTVSQWRDKIGGAHFVTGAFFNPVNTGLEVVNSLNTISIIGSDGTGQALMNDTGTPYRTGGFPSSSGTIYWVMVCDISYSESAYFSIRDGGGTTKFQFLSDDHYHLYNYGSMFFNNVEVGRHGLEIPNNSFMDGLPHIWKFTWDAGTGICKSSIDGGLRRSSSGYVAWDASSSFQGIEPGANGFNGAASRSRYCEMTLHNSVIVDDSANDVSMMNYLRRKWRSTGGSTLTTSTTTIGGLSGGAKVRSLQIANDDTLVISTDAPNCWKWVGGTTHRFSNMFAQTKLPAAFQVWGTNVYFQCYEVGIAPSDATRLYAVANLSGGNGQIWTSSNGGSSWTDLSQSIPFARHDPGPSLVVDPANANHVMIGASNGHVFESFNAGASWTDRTINAGSSYACIAFDTNAGTTTVSSVTVTAGVYIGWSAGVSAIYHSTDGGANFSTMAGSPATARCVVCGANGVVYVCDNAGGTTNAYKFAAATWTNFSSGAMTATGSTWAFCAVDRLNNGHAGFITGDGKLQYTADAGSTFYVTSAGTPFSDFPEVGDVGWVVNPSHGDLSHGGVRPPNFGGDYAHVGTRLAFNSTGRLYQGSGAGLFYTNPSDYVGQTTPSVHWTQQNDGAPGIEMTDLVKINASSADIFAPVTYSLMGYSGSASTGSITEATYFAGGGAALANGYAVDYDKASLFTQYMIFGTHLWSDATLGGEGYITDRGAITSFTGPAMMQVITGTSLVVISNGGSKYSSNSGTSWSDCLFSGSPQTFTFNKVHVLVVDSVTATTLYLVRPDTGGCWRSTDSGATWSQRHATSPGTFSEGAQLCNVPGNTGHLFFAAGLVTAAGLKRSTDGGTTWSSVASVTQAWQVSAGMTKPAGSYPSIYITGLIVGDSDPGVFRSDDTCVTWTRVSRAPAGNMDFPNKLYGDLNNYGNIYLTMASAGFTFGALDYA